MSFGILLKGWNSIYFRNAVDFIFEFIPQMLFFGGLFGYMILLIIVKWFTNFMPLILKGHGDKASGIISVFSNIYLKPEHSLISTPENQYFIQLVIIGVALVSILVIFIPKPFIVHSQLKRAAAKRKQDRMKIKSMETIEPLLDQDCSKQELFTEPMEPLLDASIEVKDMTCETKVIQFDDTVVNNGSMKTQKKKGTLKFLK